MQKVPSTALWCWWALTCLPGDHCQDISRKRRVSSAMEETIHSYDTFILESAEIGMYGRATFLFYEIERLYDSLFSNVSSRIMSPLKSCDSHIWGEFMHPCVHAVYTEVCGAKA